jgi:hypothetical protein
MTKQIDDEYIQAICKKCSNNITNFTTSKYQQEKINNYDLVIPTSDNICVLFKYNYNKEQLKVFTKHYKIKVTGNKNELISRIYCFLTLSIHAKKIQKIFRGFLQRNCNSMRGPGFKKRSLCTNGMDFFTMDDISSIAYTHFFSYKDSDGFIYGFDIISLHNLIKNNAKDFVSVTNPFNRNIIPDEIISNMKTLLRLNRVLKIFIKLEIKDDSSNISSKKSLELKILSLFQSIDALGNYSTPEWFTSLSQPCLWRFVRELADIWSYRAQITSETKRNICPPNGDPFRNISMTSLMALSSLDETRLVVLSIMDKMVNSGTNTDSRTLGSYYVLGALTLINDNAAASLPWLYQSFCYM